MCLVSWFLALPFTTLKYEETVERNVPYATVQGYYSHTPVGDRKAILELLFHSGSLNPITLEMDIYLPEGDLQETRPLLLMMHGGAFFIGNKEELGQAAWCRCQPLGRRSQPFRPGTGVCAHPPRLLTSFAPGSFEQTAGLLNSWS